MTKNDITRFTVAILRLAEIVGEAVSEPRLKAYFDALSDLSIEQIEEAARRLMNTSRFFPKPIDFREALQGSVTDQGEQAWRTFVSLCVSEGNYPSLQVSDGAMAFAIDHMGGWIEAQAKLNNASAEMVRSYEQQFKVSYRLGLQRAAESKYFVGYYEATNRGQAGRMYRAQGDEIGLAVCLVDAQEFIRLDLPFDLTQGRLTDEAKSALNSGDVRKYLPRPAVQPKALPPAEDDEPATPEEIARYKEQVRQFTLKAMPEAAMEMEDANACN
jgi:hypothetical protein